MCRIYCSSSTNVVRIAVGDQNLFDEIAFGRAYIFTFSALSNGHPPPRFEHIQLNYNFVCRPERRQLESGRMQVVFVRPRPGAVRPRVVLSGRFVVSGQHEAQDRAGVLLSAVRAQ